MGITICAEGISVTAKEMNKIWGVVSRGANANSVRSRNEGKLMIMVSACNIGKANGALG
jgi:hypothetical protein